MSFGFKRLKSADSYAVSAFTIAIILVVCEARAIYEGKSAHVLGLDISFHFVRFEMVTVNFKTVTAEVDCSVLNWIRISVRPTNICLKK